MGFPSERLVEIGGRLLFDHSDCLIALLDPAGRLIEWNAGLGQLLARAPGAVSLQQLLDLHSGARLAPLIEQALAELAAGPVILHFVEPPMALPHSYRCRAAATPAGQVILLAEPLAPLDRESAEQYMRVTNELALLTRSLQKTRWELEQKQRQLEEALERINQLAHIDELTQLLNRRSVMLRLEEEAQRSRRYGSPSSILLIDIDHFKQINDRYGHPAGDQVLRACAALLQHAIRATDHLGRYGGEEFLAVLPMTSAHAAAGLAERLRLLVEAEPFTVAKTVAFSLTVSIGVASFDPAADTSSLLIAHADAALYAAKAQGRNAVRAWSPA